jgi:protein required for attachment to host cells
MSQALVTIIDGTKARFLSLEQPELPEYESGPNLIERKEVLNPTKELSGEELWATVKTGRNKGVGGFSHAYDDHRQNHLDEFDRRFAQTIANEVVNLSQTYQTQRIFLVAEPQLLGVIREALAPLLLKNKSIQIQELAKDLCKLKPLEIHEHLAQKNLLPARRKATS